MKDSFEFCCSDPVFEGPFTTVPPSAVTSIRNLDNWDGLVCYNALYATRKFISRSLYVSARVCRRVKVRLRRRICKYISGLQRFKPEIERVTCFHGTSQVKSLALNRLRKSFFSNRVTSQKKK